MAQPRILYEDGRPYTVPALRAVRRFPASAFEPYKLTPDEVDALTARLLGWAEEIKSAAR
jgi:hypothetical protein